MSNDAHTTTPLLSTITSTLTEILSCPVEVFADDASLLAFQEEHCIDPHIQPAFTAPALREFGRTMPERVVHEVEEPLGMAIATARWAQWTLIIGPYTHAPLYPGVAEETLRRLAIPSAYLSSYKLYRTRYAIVDPEYVYRGAVAVMRAAGIEETAGGLQHVKATGGTIAPGQAEPPHSASSAVIEERYRHEQDFMDAVAEGSTDGALAALQRLSGMPRVSGYLTTPFLGITILRIMARVAAQRGGLPAVRIDAISQEYAQRLHRSGHTADARRTLKYTSHMVTDFCEAVRKHRQLKYPMIVRRVVDEVDLHLSSSTSTADLASRLGVSPSTLARRFKEATGTTLAGYVAQRRTAKAAHLLATTRESVREIAGYVGYDDANYFVKVFRAEYGMTPSAYRDSHTR